MATVRKLDRPMIDLAIVQANKLRADVVRKAFGLVLHSAVIPATTLATVDEADLPTTINAFVTAYEAHRVSAFVASTNVGAHASADSTNAVSAAVATNLATSITRANELKVDLNAHIAVTAKHMAASSAAVAAANATDSPTLITLLNDIYSVLSAHILDSFASEVITVVDA